VPEWTCAPLPQPDIARSPTKWCQLLAKVYHRLQEFALVNFTQPVRITYVNARPAERLLAERTSVPGTA